MRTFRIVVSGMILAVGAIIMLPAGALVALGDRIHPDYRPSSEEDDEASELFTRPL